MRSLFSLRPTIVLAILMSTTVVSAADSDPNQSGADAAMWDSLVSLLTPQTAPAVARSGGAAEFAQEELDELDPLIDTLIIEDLELVDPNDVETPAEPNSVDSTAEPNAVDTAAEPDPNYPPEPQAVPLPRYPAQPAAPAESTIALFGKEWTADMLGTAAFGDSQGELYTGALSLETHIWDKWRLVLQPFAGIGQGDDDTTGVFGLDHLLKYPLFSSGAMEINFEGGGGVQQAGPKSWPDSAPHFTARGILGAGLEWNTAQNQRLLFGARWLHVSDTFLNDDEKVHVDSLMLYGGWRLRF